MNLKELLAQKLSKKPTNLPITTEVTSNCTDEEKEKNLQVFLLLCLRIEYHQQKSLCIGDWFLLRQLAAICSPFPTYNKELIEIVPAFYQSYYLWNIANIINIPPGILWKKIRWAQIEAEKILVAEKFPIG